MKVFKVTNVSKMASIKGSMEVIAENEQSAIDQYCSVFENLLTARGEVTPEKPFDREWFLAHFRFEEVKTQEKSNGEQTN